MKNQKQSFSKTASLWIVAAFVLLAAPSAYAQYTNNYQTNTYTGPAQSTGWWINPSLPDLGFANYIVGSNTAFDVLQVINGAGLTNASGWIGYMSNVASNNLAMVSGSGSLWTNTGTLEVGYGGSGNQLIITDGGRVVSGGVALGNSVNARNNMVVVGSGSLLRVGGTLYVGASGLGNQLIITNGGQVVSVAGYNYMGAFASSSNNMAVVSGSGSLWTNVLDIYVGVGATTGNRLIITNGGSVFTPSVTVGKAAGATGNTVWIGSGGLLDANSLIVTNSGNSITNFGGIFQFSGIAPTITTNNGGVGGAIVLTNGTISFRNVATADVKGNWSSSQLTNITFQGDNTFRLNAASNSATAQDYTFDVNLGATNYIRLEMINGATAWRGGSLTIGSGGTLLVSNTVARIAGAVTNSGTMTVVNGAVVYGGNVINLGAYVSDPSTNNFNGTFTVGPTATVVAAAGDIYAFGADLVMQSTNRAFNMSLAQVVFATNGYGIATTTSSHTLNLTNSGAVDMGSNGFMSAVQLATNFSIGTLSIALSNNLTVTGNKSGATTNALYVGWLDLTAWNTNAASLSATLSNALTLTDINLYYDAGDARNAYLQDASYALWGSGGLLIPIPEPSAAGLILGGALFSAWLLRRKGGWR